jgi:hypothetical protein
MRNRIDDHNGKNGAMPKEADKPSPTKIPATQADWLASHLHEARLKITTIRAELIERTKQLISKDQRILQLENRILQLESANVDEENKELRAAHGLSLGRTLHRDDATGDVYWLDDDHKSSQ